MNAGPGFSGWCAQRGRPSDAFRSDVGVIHRQDFSCALHGEVHNTRELCHELGLPEHTDLPRLLEAGWRRWSTGLLARLDGVFALLLRDGEQLLLYRDPSGLCNLYCSLAAGALAFATSLPALLNLPGVPRRLARRSLHEYLRFLDIAAPNTLFEGVSALEAGRAMQWPRPGAAPPEPLEEVSPGTFAEAVDLLDGLLQQSVQARLAGAAQPAAFLSGGVDSSLLCAMAVRQNSDLVALTVGFEGARYDEVPVARGIASHLGMRHEVLRFDREQYLRAFDTLNARMEQPSADPAIPATVLALEHCRRRFDTVLDGTGADEVVGSLPPRHVRWAVAYAGLLSPRLRSALTQLMRVTPGLAGYTPITDFEHPADTMIRWHGFTRLEIEALCDEPVSFADTQFYQTFARFPREAHFERFSALVNVMPCERLNQATHATGLWLRYPYWHGPTVRFIRQLRTDHRHTQDEPKRILRALLARYAPEELWNLPKHGFDFPLLQFLRAEDCALVRRLLAPGRWLRVAGLAPDRVAAYAHRFIDGEHRLGFRVWALVVLSAWLDNQQFSY